MGYEAKKTEHAGPKHGNGAYWGYRWDAKKENIGQLKLKIIRKGRSAVFTSSNTAARA